MDRQTEGRTDNRDYVGVVVGPVPIIKVTLKFPEFISKHKIEFILLISL